MRQPVFRVLELLPGRAQPGSPPLNRTLEQVLKLIAAHDMPAGEPGLLDCQDSEGSRFAHDPGETGAFQAADRAGGDIAPRAALRVADVMEKSPARAENAV